MFVTRRFLVAHDLVPRPPHLYRNLCRKERLTIVYTNSFKLGAKRRTQETYKTLSWSH